MANRYVWQKYNLVSSLYEYSQTREQNKAYRAYQYTQGAPDNGTPIKSTATGIYCFMFSQKEFRPSQGYFLSGDCYVHELASAEDAPHTFTNPSAPYVIFSPTYLDMWSGVIAKKMYEIQNGRITIDVGTSDFYELLNANGNFTEWSALSSYTAGTTDHGKVSATSKSQYPADSYSGDYWYDYLGYDCIDPTAVGYSTTKPKAGESITVNVTARSNTYGGTIYYQYQYSTDGGSTWTNAGSKTTATSKAITVPSGATQFRARVVASDNYGFTSTTYVTGANLTMGCINAGVGGVIKTGTPVVCVGGAVKTSVKAYQCVGGVIKQS